MNVIGKDVLQKFKKMHADAKDQIDAWQCEVEEAKWLKLSDIKDRYPSASILKDNMLIFNIKGNKYRLLVKVNYINQVVLIKRVGTHAEYSRWRL